jgi:hypothetical protein
MHHYVRLRCAAGQTLLRVAQQVVTSAAVVICRYSMYNSPLPNMRQHTDFYHTEVRHPRCKLRVLLLYVLVWIAAVCMHHVAAG